MIRPQSMDHRNRAGDTRPHRGARKPQTLRQVTRAVAVVEGTLPAAGTPARVDNFVYRRDPERDLGLAFERLTLSGPVGGVAAWYVPPAEAEGWAKFEAKTAFLQTSALTGENVEAFFQGLAYLAYKHHATLKELEKWRNQYPADSAIGG